MRIGTRPRGVRGSGVWTPAALAFATNVSRRTIEHYQSGETRPPDVEKLAEAFFGTDPNRAAARTAFLIAYADATGTEPPPWAFATSNIPVRVPAHFMGRGQALEAVREAMVRELGRVTVTALYGMRGVGKSTMAAAYAERHRADYRATWWVRAESDALARADLVALGVRMGWIGDELSASSFAAVEEKLRTEGDGVLLVLDGALGMNGLSTAQTVGRYIPTSGASHCIVTTTDPALGTVAHVLEVGLWDEELSADYLTATTGRSAERATAKVLADELGCLPLALEQAAAYCDRLDIPLDEYLRRFRAAPVKAIDHDAVASPEYRNGLTVAKTFSLAIEAADALQAGTADFVSYVAMLSLSYVPVRLFMEAPALFPEPLSSALRAQDGVDAIVSVLRSFSLINRESVRDERFSDASTDCVRLHNLVRIVADARPVEDRPGMLSTMLQALANVYPKKVVGDGLNWPLARILDDIANHLVATVPDTTPNKQILVDLLQVLAAYEFGASAQYERAEGHMASALDLALELYGPRHEKVATAYDNMANVHRARDRFAEAQRCRENALSLREEIRGPTHPETLATKHNLANLLSHLGRFSEAIPLYRAVLDAQGYDGIGEIPEEASYVDVLANYARTLRAVRDFDSALIIQEKFLSLRERNQQVLDVRLANFYASFSVLLRDMGVTDRSIYFCQKALFLRKRIYGLIHSDVATSLNNLGNLCRQRRRLSRAQMLHECAMRVRVIVYGEGHTEVAMSHNNLGLVLLDRNNADAAIESFERALAIYEPAFGQEHPHTKEVKRNIARLKPF
jgi:tetratricopeptide (TPR) repeat protein